MEFDFAALAGAVTDPEARAQFFSDPRGYLESIGVSFPAFLTIKAEETDSPTMTMGIPPLMEDGELSELALDGVSGGAGAAAACSL